MELRGACGTRGAGGNRPIRPRGTPPRAREAPPTSGVPSINADLFAGDFRRSSAQWGPATLGEVAGPYYWGKRSISAS
ncbi:hypothetical protein JCM9533A_39960 [Catenuloplanes niger JCM 9533]